MTTIKTAEDVRREVNVYEVIQTHLYNGTLVVAYQSPNGLWWSSWHLGAPAEDLEELCDFAAHGQLPDWPGWVKLRPWIEENSGEAEPYEEGKEETNDDV